MSIPRIETERLVLRAPDEGDFPAYRDFFGDAEASRFYGGPLDAGRAWRVLASDLGHWALRGYGRWAVEVKDGGQFVGGCGLWWPGGWPRSELTWWILPAARRRGYALEASRAVIRYAYRSLGWKLVETHTDDDNAPARALVARLGGRAFAREAFPDGIVRHIYGLPNL